MPRFAAAPSPSILDWIARAMPVVFAAAVAGILLGKLFLIWRINVNWDEFFYLSNVYALERSELDLLLQGAYTHLFRWAAMPGVNEVDLVDRLRLVMWPLLALSCWLLYRLARRFASPVAALFAVLAFAGSWPVLKHGASFRADSMLLPLMLGMLLLVTRPGGLRLANDIAVGLCLGAAFTLTTKAVLVLPVLLAMIALPVSVEAKTDSIQWNSAIRRITIIFFTASLLSALLIAGHSLQVTAAAEPAGEFAARTVTAALIDVPILPRGNYFSDLATEDPIYWLALLAGLWNAIRLRAYSAAASVLALLPILFYRNAYPYYYPIMMAPAAVLVALAGDGVRDSSLLNRRPGIGLLVLGASGFLLIQHAWDGLMTLRFDEQQEQRSVVTAVHQVFPNPVRYIDHSGMIASYPKANFLMSSWGMESYRRQGRDFMPGVLATSRPPLLLANHGVLRPRTPLYRQFSETDRRLLEASYVDYWGPIKVAGAEIQLPADSVVTFRVPFPGRYRLETSAPIRLNGQLLGHGDTQEIEHADDAIQASASVAHVAVKARLVWAEARDPPHVAPPRLPLYSPL